MFHCHGTLEVYIIFRGREPTALDVYTTFVTDNSRSWKCILFLELETLEVKTTFGSENRRSVYYFPL